MSYTEKSAWIMAAIAMAIGFYYFGSGHAMTTLADAETGRELGSEALRNSRLLMFKLSFAWIIASIVLHIVAAIASPSDSGLQDERDLRIDRFGDRIGQYLVVTAAVGALGMAVYELNHYWIAQTLFAGLVLGSLLSSLTKIAAYRWGLLSW